jgi:urease accessory protein UreE
MSYLTDTRLGGIRVKWQTVQIDRLTHRQIDRDEKRASQTLPLGRGVKIDLSLMMIMMHDDWIQMTDDSFILFFFS